jgi:hypothetical protein
MTSWKSGYSSSASTSIVGGIVNPSARAQPSTGCAGHGSVTDWASGTLRFTVLRRIVRRSAIGRLEDGPRNRLDPAQRGFMRIAVSIGVALALLAGPASAQKADRPDVKVGDRWQFVRYYAEASTNPNLTWAIHSVTETEISGTENGEPLRMTPELNVVDSPERQQSNARALSFPLEVGKRWRYSTDWLFKPKGSSGSLVVDVEVAAHETVVVPAGVFEAFKLVSQGRVSGTSPINSQYDAVITTTYWYAAEPRAIVKSVTHNPYLGASTVELVAFQLQP